MTPLQSKRSGIMISVTRAQICSSCSSSGGNVDASVPYSGTSSLHGFTFTIVAVVPFPRR